MFQSSVTKRFKSIFAALRNDSTFLNISLCPLILLACFLLDILKRKCISYVSTLKVSFLGEHVQFRDLADQPLRFASNQPRQPLLLRQWHIVDLF